MNEGVPQNYQMKVTCHGMTPEELAISQAIEDEAKTRPQVKLETQHDLHAGMYTRTIKIPHGHTITGALIKIPTLLVMVGCGKVFLGDEVIELSGYAVLAAEANRKQVFEAITDVYLTMIFPTQATTVAECEKEFTDQWAELLSNRGE